MRTKKTLINISTSLLLEVVTIVYGFVVPRLIIRTFGSEVNGLICSIANYIGYITLLQSGVGSVVKASLYKPLANKDKDTLNTIVATANRFFDKIAVITVIYILLLSVCFPLLTGTDFGWFYTASLVVIIGASTAAQYFFGITYQMLLEADQRAYIYSFVQIVSILINTILVVILIRLDYSIQIVKLATAFIYVLRPIIIGLYVRKQYRISSHVPTDNDLIKQRWDGFIQAIALFIHQKTDIFVLTLLSTFINVSIYSVYSLIAGGLTAIISAVDKAVRSAFGNIIACNEHDNLISSFNAYNTIIHFMSTVFFATATITVFQFVKIYTNGISDANYIQKSFGVLILTAEYIYSLRSPYNTIIYATGKFKETKIPAAIEAVVNISLSCLLVPVLGLSGVAIGTLIAMSYRTVSFVRFLSRNILYLNIITQLKRFLVSFASYGFSILLFSKIPVGRVDSYFTWILYAIVIMVANTVTTLLFFISLDNSGLVGAYTLTKQKIKNIIK